MRDSKRRWGVLFRWGKTAPTRFENSPAVFMSQRRMVDSASDWWNLRNRRSTLRLGSFSTYVRVTLVSSPSSPWGRNMQSSSDHSIREVGTWVGVAGGVVGDGVGAGWVAVGAAPELQAAARARRATIRVKVIMDRIR